MNRLFFTLVLFFSVGFSATGLAQGPVSGFPVPGDSFRYSRAAKLPLPELQKKGPNQNWDLHSLKPTAQRRVDVKEPSQAGPTFREWPEIYDRAFTDLAFSGEDMLPQPFSLSDLTYFYNTQNDSLPPALHALSGVFHLKNASHNFQVEVRSSGDRFGYPLSMGKSFRSQQNVDFVQRETGTRFALRRSRTAVADASGTMILPADTFPSIRVRTEITTTVDFSTGGVSIPQKSLTIVQYSWHSTESAMPVLLVAEQTEGGETFYHVDYQDVHRDLKHHAMITNDAVVLGILLIILALIFFSSSLKTGFWSKFYTYIPALLLCYFVPSLLNTLGIISGEESSLYFVSSRYLLPTSLVLLTLSIDLSSIRKLGPKAIQMFLAGTLGIVIGGPLAIIIVSSFSPETVGGEAPNEVWRGLATIAGSWIGGGANQTAMKEVFGAGDKIFSMMIAVDVIVANVWMGFLLYGSGITKKIDRIFKADSSAIDEVRKNLEDYQAQVAKIPNLTDTVILMAIGFGVTALSHFLADIIAPWVGTNFPELAKFSLNSKFFWLIVLATTGGLLMSFTRARKMEGVGASRMGSLFLYVLVASIGMKMDVMSIFENPMLFLVGFIWMVIHASVQLGVGRLIKAPFFFIAVGSQANVGGAASAPVVASAFHPALAPVGVLLAVLGYALGTYAAYVCGLLMQWVAP